MAVSATLLTAGGTGSATTTFTTASITPSANKLIGVWVLTDNGTPNSISGCGLTWVRDVLDTGLVPVAFFRSLGASPSTGTLSISLGGNSTGSWIIVEYDGVDTTGTNGSGAIVQTAHTTGAGATSATISLASAITSGNATAAAIIKGGVSAFTAGSGYAILGSTSASGFAAHAHEWAAAGTQNPGFTWTGSANWAGIAVEIKAAGGGTDGNVTAVQSTATADALAPALTASATITMPAAAAATADALAPVVSGQGDATVTVPAPAAATGDALVSTVGVSVEVLVVIAEATAAALLPTLAGGVMLSPPVATAAADALVPQFGQVVSGGGHAYAGTGGGAARVDRPSGTARVG